MYVYFVPSGRYQILPNVSSGSKAPVAGLDPNGLAAGQKPAQSLPAAAVL